MGSLKSKRITGRIGIRETSPEHMIIENNQKLTGRERQVLLLLMEGKPSKEIGSILKISKQTVDTHRKNMLRKKNLKTTGQLIGKAIMHGWI